MKVLMINGSPHEKGCTYTALNEIAIELEKFGVESEIFTIGTKVVRGCIGCGGCAGKGQCVFSDDCVNEAIMKAKNADGFIFGSPVHYAAASGSMTSFMDRFCYAGGKNLAYKPAACIASARRAGTSATYDQLNKYIGITNMIMVPSIYWNMVHGSKPEDVLKDEEGLQIMRTLGKNMAWLLYSLDCAKENGIALPKLEDRVRTNFIS